MREERLDCANASVGVKLTHTYKEHDMITFLTITALITVSAVAASVVAVVTDGYGRIPTRRMY
jgi:hypothetical protein